MRDQFGRKIDYMRISVTDRCNLRCRYCMPAEGVAQVPHSKILRFDELLRLTKAFADCGIRKIKITGGEPLVRRGIVELIREMKAVSGIEEVTLTTNGILIGQRPQLAEELAEAGVSSINISLDTLKKDRYEAVTGTDGLEDVLRALDVCCSVPGLKVKVNTVTLADYNRDEIAELASLARDREIDVRFIEIMPVGLGKSFPGYSQDDIMDELQRTYGPAELYQGPKTGNGPAVYYCFDGFNGRIGMIGALSHEFCGGCNRVRLTSEGFLKPCLQYAGGVDLRQLLRDGTEEEVLRQAIRAGIYNKPRQHAFCSEEAADKDDSHMSFIGG